MDALLQDIRFAARKLARQPGFSIAALLTLSLGIGASALLFTILNAALFRAPAAVRAPDQLVWVHTSDYSSGPLGTSSYADFVDFAKQKQVFQSMTASFVQMTGTGTADAPGRVGTELVTDSYFNVFGVAVRGRSFTANEAGTGAPVVVVSDYYWRTQMAGAIDAIGKTIKLNAAPFTVIGIAAPGFRGSIHGMGNDVFIPMRSGERIGSDDIVSDNRGDRDLTVIARLAPGMKMNLAQNRMDILAGQMFKAFPEMWKRVQGDGRRITLVSERASRLPPQLRSMGLALTVMLSGIAALVLLICCANVAGLMLARASGMTKEMGIRISMGASRLRIARLLLFESMVLAAVAAGIALLITKWLADIALAALGAVPIPLNLDFNIDTSVILFTTIIATLSAVAFGAVPALRASRADPATVLKSTNHQVNVGGHKFSFRSVLVGVQVAASIVLLVTALLFLRSMKSAFNADLGFDMNNVALMSLEPEPGYNPSDIEALGAATAVTDALAQTASVQHATWIDNPPLAFSSNRRGTYIDGYQARSGEDLEFHFNDVGPAFLSTVGIPIVKGRDITAQDRAESPQVAVVNQKFADRFWPGADPIGKRISFDNEHWRTVVGVAKDARIVSVGSGEIQPHIFVPMLQEGWRGTEIAAKTDNLTGDKLKALKGVVQKAAPRWIVRNERTFYKQAEAAILPQRIASTVLSLFGMFALFLAAVGLYGVIAYAVTQRQNEFGIRFALGATPRDVLRMMLGQGLRVVLIGAIAGLILTAGAAQLLKSLLLGLSPLDPVSFIAAPLFLVGVSTLATLMPARRASRADPLNALRGE